MVKTAAGELTPAIPGRGGVRPVPDPARRRQFAGAPPGFAGQAHRLPGQRRPPRRRHGTGRAADHDHERRLGAHLEPAARRGARRRSRTAARRRGPAGTAAGARRRTGPARRWRLEGRWSRPGTPFHRHEVLLVMRPPVPGDVAGFPVYDDLAGPDRELVMHGSLPPCRPNRSGESATPARGRPEPRVPRRSGGMSRQPLGPADRIVYGRQDTVIVTLAVAAVKMATIENLKFLAS